MVNPSRAGLPANWVLYWDGDLLSELGDGVEKESCDFGVYKYNWESGAVDTIDVLDGKTNNSTKNNPSLTADILGDWREEVVLRNEDDTELRIYMTTTETDYMIYTLMHDPVYRNCVANQNSAYNQPPHIGFYLGEDNKEQVLSMNLPIANIGKVDNKGYEINLKWEDRINEVRYNIGANLSYAKNKVVFIDEITYPYEWMQTEGKPVGQQFGYVFDGYFTEEEAANYENLKGNIEGGIPDQGSGYVPLAGDVKYKDLNKDGKIDEKDVRDIGYPKYPLYTAGMNLGVSWKGFDFSMTWSAAFKTSRLLSSMYRVPFGESNNSAVMKYMIEDAWTPEKGNSAKAPALSFKSKSHNYQDSDLWLRDASYVRLKNIELGYSFPSSLMKKAHIGSLRLFVSGYNLLTFDKLKVSDPEANPDGTAYPLIKVVNVGLKVGF